MTHQQGCYRELLLRIHIGSLIKSDYEILEKKKSFKRESFEIRLNKLCKFINISSDTVCLLFTHMCDVLNAAMLSRIGSKEIL